MPVTAQQQRAGVALPHGARGAGVVDDRPAEVLRAVDDAPKLPEADAVVFGAQPETAGEITQKDTVVTSEHGKTSENMGTNDKTKAIWERGV